VERGGWIYFMTNRRNGILYAASLAIYLGVLSNIVKVWLTDSQGATD
jgi:hypothetical protein